MVGVLCVNCESMAAGPCPNKHFSQQYAVWICIKFASAEHPGHPPWVSRASPWHDVQKAITSSLAPVHGRSGFSVQVGIRRQLTGAQRRTCSEVPRYQHKASYCFAAQAGCLPTGHCVTRVMVMAGETYLRTLAAAKAGAPDIHVHAFSPLEVCATFPHYPGLVQVQSLRVWP